MVRVVQAEPEHVDGICRVCREGWRDAYAGIGTDEETEATVAEFYDPEQVRSEVESPDGWHGWLVALDDEDRVIGAGGGGTVEGDVGEVFVLYVDPDRRREGAGTALLSAITDRHREDGAETQVVSIVPSNGPARSFYERRGFEPAEESTDGEGSGRGLSSLRFERDL
jgi:GNAT superfamily N-acetyltransferase